MKPWTCEHDATPENTLTSEREKAIETAAEIAADEAFAWGDRLHNWADSGEDVRDSFRVTAAKILDALIAAGWSSPEQWEQVGWQKKYSHGWGAVIVQSEQVAPDAVSVPVFRRKP